MILNAKLIFIITLLFAVNPGHAQENWSDYYNKSEILAQEGNLTSATTEINKAIALTSSGTIENAVCIQQLAFIQHLSGNHAESIKTAQSSITVFEKLNESLNLGISQYLVADAQLALKDTTKAYTSYTQAAEAFIKSGDEAVTVYADALSMLLWLTRFDDAVFDDLLTETLNAVENTEEVCSDAALRTYSKASEYWIRKNKPDKVSELAEIILNVNCTEPETEYYASILLSYAEALYHQGDNYLGSVVLSEYLKTGKNESRALVLAATFLNYDGEYQEATELLKTLTPQNVKSLRPPYRIEYYKQYASAQMQTGNYQGALSNYRVALTENETLYGKFSSSSMMIRNDISVCLFNDSRYKEAMDEVNKAIELCKDRADLRDVSFTLKTNKASILTETGNYEEAENLLLSLIETSENNTNYVQHLSLLNTLASIYIEQSEYAQAEILLKEQYNKSVSVQGKTGMSFATAANSLASMYFEMGNFDQSIKHYEEALTAIKALYGEESVQYSAIINNLALIYSELGEHQEAITLLENVKTIEEKIYGKKHPDYALTLANIAAIYVKVKEFDKATAYFTSALGVFESTKGRSQIDYANTLRQMALMFENQAKLKEADRDITKVVSIMERSLGKKSLQYAVSCIDMARIKGAQKDFATAERLFRESVTILRSEMDDKLAFLPEREKSMFISRYSGHFDDYLTYCTNQYNSKNYLSEDAYNLILSQKGMLLQSATKFRNLILNSGKHELLDTYNQWIIIKNKVSELSALSNESLNQRIEQLNSEADALERKLMEQASETGLQNGTNSKTWNQVQERLKEGEAVIEFFSYSDKARGEDQYCALILTKTSSRPILYPLCTSTQLEKAIGLQSSSNPEIINNIYKAGSGSDLYALVWEPLTKSLTSIYKIYISPTGLLHRVSFHAISSENKYLIDAYELLVTNSSGVLIDQNNSNANQQFDNLCMMGGIDYNLQKNEQDVWPYLEGTLTETKEISQIVKSGKRDVTYLTGQDATETAFKEQAINSDVIHIATHGFFFPDPLLVHNYKKENSKTEDEIEFRGKSRAAAVSVFTENRDPLMRSGLLFAGANDLWNDRKYARRDDGVLTASEVAQMNLAKTKLVVLSACETGLGDINGNEGVYGLQRAFKLSGIHYIIMSLWQVPDKETKEFMVHFYKELDAGSDIEKAFVSTQREMSKKYPPYFWAAFELLH